MMDSVEDLILTMAKAAHASSCAYHGHGWDEAPDDMREMLLAEQRAIIRSIQRAGFVIAPMKPTPLQIEKGEDCDGPTPIYATHDVRADAEDHYEAMVAASPMVLADG